MSVYEPNSRHLREVLIFYFNMKKSAVKTHRMLSNTYDENTISERMSGFNALRTVIFMSKTGIAVEEWRFPKMQNWRHYLMKTRVKVQKNWHDHWEWFDKQFQHASKHGNDSDARKLGAVRIETEMFNGVCLLVNNYMKGKDERDFCIALWLGPKNGFITITPNTKR